MAPGLGAGVTPLVGGGVKGGRSQTSKEKPGHGLRIKRRGETSHGRMGQKTENCRVNRERKRDWVRKPKAKERGP